MKLTFRIMSSLAQLFLLCFGSCYFKRFLKYHSNCFIQRVEKSVTISFVTIFLRILFLLVYSMLSKLIILELNERKVFYLFSNSHRYCFLFNCLYTLFMLTFRMFSLNLKHTAHRSKCYLVSHLVFFILELIIYFYLGIFSHSC